MKYPAQKQKSAVGQNRIGSAGTWLKSQNRFEIIADRLKELAQEIEDECTLLDLAHQHMPDQPNDKFEGFDFSEKQMLYEGLLSLVKNNSGTGFANNDLRTSSLRDWEKWQVRLCRMG